MFAPNRGLTFDMYVQCLTAPGGLWIDLVMFTKLYFTAYLIKQYK